MRLCSVCDNKIEGKWCKHCHRFVKSYESSSSIYGQEEISNNERMAGNSPVHASDNRPERNVKGKTSNKKNKAAVYGLGLSAVLTCALPLLPDIIGLFQASAERAEANREYLDEITFSEEERKYYGDRMLRNSLILGIEPAESVIERDYRVFYFNPEDIKELGYPCDEKHFELQLTEFEQWLAEQWTDAYEYEEDSSIYSNLRSIQGENESYRFATYRDYRDGSEFSVQADFDTATEQLHSVYISVEGTSADIGLYCGLLKKFYPKSIWTEAEFTKALIEAVESGEEYVEFYSSKYAKIAYLKKDGGYSLGYTPGDGSL